jgi:hypothetical protein
MSMSGEKEIRKQNKGLSRPFFLLRECGAPLTRAMSIWNK